MVRIAIVALAVALLVGGSGAAACKFALDCGLGNRLGVYGETGPPVDVPPIPTGRASLPDGWRERTVVAGLRFPTDFAFLPSGDVVVSEKNGLVRVATPGTGRPRVVLDLRSRVSASTYRGLLAVSLDPAFPREPYVYLLYTAAVVKTDAPTMSHVSRFTWRRGRLDPSSERRIVSVAVEQQHSGGQIAFAPDGTLFVSTGDGVHSEEVPKALVAQDVDALQGKVLRVTRDGEGVPQNPFWNGNPDATRSKVWAYGFRNPFRLVLQPASMTPVVGDVGYKGEDEISVAARGSNNGWPCYEGVSRGPAGYPNTDVCEELYGRGESAHNPPVVSFDHDDSASITGGAFLDGEAVGSEAQLVYVFADFSYGWLRYLELDETRLQPDPIAFAEGLPGPVALHAGKDGALYYLSVTTGELRRLERDR